MPTAEKVEKLPEIFPRLFRENCEISIWDGWFDILYRLCAELQAYIDAHPEMKGQFEIIKIKEKFGMLTFQYRIGVSEERRSDIMEIVARYTDEATRTCELCGAPGRLRQYDWMKAECDACDAKRRKKEKDYI